MSRLCIAFSLLLISYFVKAQTCGTPQLPLLERVEENQKSLKILQRGTVKYVPVTFHLVANAAGNGRVQETAILDQLCNLNKQYADQEVVFYIDTFKYMENDAVYETPSSTAATIQMRVRKDPNSVNIYVTNNAESGNGGPGVTLAYYDPQEDWIVSRKDQISASSKTLAHEVGHFFSLPHPHAGWDCFPYTVEDYGNPVNKDFTIQCQGGGGSLLIELQNGSNCNSAGDKICDTPADYNLGLVYDPGCDENTTVRDKNGELITPLVQNYMSYYSGCSMYSFTPMQKNIMNTDFFTLRRTYIRLPYIPVTDSVEAPVTYLTPINGELTPGLTNILLDWEDTPGATNYIVMVARNSNFTLNVQTFLTTESQVIIDELPLQTYFWRVWPYNESKTCAGFSATQTFKVSGGTSVNEIAAIDAYDISPNPSSNHELVYLNLSSVKAFGANLTVTNASGGVVSNTTVEIISGENQYPIETANLPAGLYFVMLSSPNGRLVEKLLIF
jgi:hypothetical protein